MVFPCYQVGRTSQASIGKEAGAMQVGTVALDEGVGASLAHGLPFLLLQISAFVFCFSSFSHFFLFSFLLINFHFSIPFLFLVSFYKSHITILITSYP